MAEVKRWGYKKQLGNLHMERVIAELKEKADERIWDALLEWAMRIKAAKKV